MPLDPKVAAALERHQITFRVVECDPLYADTAEFCAQYNYSPQQAANTLLVSAKGDAGVMCACVVLATTKLDVNKKVCQLLGVKRASFAPAELTTARTGMVVGGVVAVGLPDDVPVYIDQAVMHETEIIMGGGNRTTKLLLSPQELLKLPGSTVVDGLAAPR